MTDLLDEVCDWVRGGAYVSDAARLTDAVMAEDARLLADAFTGEAGRRRLMTFARMTVLRPPVDHSLPDGQREAYAQLRQGQDSIFAGLVRYLDLHEANLKAQTDDPSDDYPAAADASGWSAARRPDAGDERFTDPAGGWDPAGLVGGR